MFSASDWLVEGRGVRRSPPVATATGGSRRTPRLHECSISASNPFLRQCLMHLVDRISEAHREGRQYRGTTDDAHLRHRRIDVWLERMGLLRSHDVSEEPGEARRSMASCRHSRQCEPWGSSVRILRLTVLTFIATIERGATSGRSRRFETWRTSTRMPQKHSSPRSPRVWLSFARGRRRPRRALRSRRRRLSEHSGA